MDSQNNTNLILPLITLFIGTMLGFLSSLLISYLQQKHNVAIRVLEQYLKIREGLCDKLSSLASTRTDNTLSYSSLSDLRDEISMLFYKYYDFLPSEVLKEMLCLHACLSDKQNKIYRCKNNSLLPIEDSEIEEFIEQIAMVENFKYYALIPLNSKDDNVRRATSIRYQARSVLVAMNKYFTLKELMTWAKHLPKHYPK